MEGTNYSFLRGSSAFRTELFDEVDVDYNLDYCDSNGTRHEQTLAHVNYLGSDVPNLIAASLTYLPCDTGDFETDRFIGIVACELPRVGTRHLKDTSSIVSVLSRKLQADLGLACQVHALTDTVIVYDESTDTTIEFRASIPPGKQHLDLSVTVPTDHTLDKTERYSDVRLTADLWIFLNDFAANLSIDMDCHPSDLGRYTFHESNPHQTLHVGVPRAPDFCRLGMELLNAQDALKTLSPDEIIPELTKSVDYVKWDEQLKSADDDTIASISRRAITLARGGIVSNNIIQISIEAEMAFSHL